MSARPYPEVSSVFNLLLRHEDASKHGKRPWDLFAFLISVEMRTARTMRERRDIQRNLYLIESNLNLAWFGERLGQAPNCRIVEKRSQWTTSKS
jgi:hypothetical protein